MTGYWCRYFRTDFWICRNVWGWSIWMNVAIVSLELCVVKVDINICKNLEVIKEHKRPPRQLTLMAFSVILCNQEQAISQDRVRLPWNYCLWKGNSYPFSWLPQNLNTIPSVIELLQGLFYNVFQVLFNLKTHFINWQSTSHEQITWCGRESLINVFDITLVWSLMLVRGL